MIIREIYWLVLYMFCGAMTFKVYYDQPGAARFELTFCSFFCMMVISQLVLICAKLYISHLERRIRKLLEEYESQEETI